MLGCPILFKGIPQEVVTLKTKDSSKQRCENDATIKDSSFRFFRVSMGVLSSKWNL
jgi:hypothetical protein